MVRGAGYRDGKAVLVPTALPPAEVSQRTITLFIQDKEKWRETVKKNLGTIPWQVEYLEDPSRADILIGDETLAVAPEQILLQADSRTIHYVTGPLLLHLQKQGLLQPGTVLFVSHLVKGDLGEAVLIFA